jgi:hypothetical protein
VLESNTLAISSSFGLGTCDIKDGESGELVGTAVEIVGSLSRVLRRMFGFRLVSAPVEVREKPDDSLVFTIHRGTLLFRSRVEVCDSQDYVVGHFRAGSLGDGFQIYDKDGTPFANVRGKSHADAYEFLTCDGARVLAEVSRDSGGLAAFAVGTRVLKVNPELAEQPIAKMLLLAAALAVELFYKPVSDRESEARLC